MLCPWGKTVARRWIGCHHYDPAVPLLGIYPEKIMAQKDTCTPVFTEALFTVAETQKQPKCPSTEEWIKKMRYTHTMEYYSATGKNEAMPFTATWMDLENVILSAGSQTEREVLYDIPYLWNLKRNDTNELTYKTERDSQT